MSGKTKSFYALNTSSFCVPDKRIHLDRITFCRNRNNKRTIYRRYRLMLFAALLPFQKEIKPKHNPVRLPFLYKGSYEYIRIFRQSFWVYILLFLFATAGTVHGNIKINKVCLILWGLVQASGYLQTMDNRYLLHFKNFKTLYLFQLKSIAWNVSSPPFLSASAYSVYL